MNDKKLKKQISFFVACFQTNKQTEFQIRNKSNEILILIPKLI